jgi:hypothetical protein
LLEWILSYRDDCSDCHAKDYFYRKYNVFYISVLLAAVVVDSISSRFNVLNISISTEFRPNRTPNMAARQIELVVLKVTGVKVQNVTFSWHVSSLFDLEYSNIVLIGLHFYQIST